MSHARPLLPGREPFNGYSHLLAAFAAAVAGAFLVCGAWELPGLAIARGIYAVSLFLAFFSSALFHLATGPADRIERLRRWDHCCIRGLIAGTYAPLSYVMLPGIWPFIIWPAFTFLVFAEDLFTSSSRAGRIRKSVSYITLASLSLIAVPFLWHRFKEPILWTSFGSCFYIAGSWCYLKKFPGKSALLDFHGMWHIFVIIGAAVHFTVIYQLR